jgi:DNA-binding response OmpR family regulator
MTSSAEPAREEAGSALLIVENDRHTRTFLTDNLAVDGFDAIAAVSAPEALGLLKTRDLDLAIISLPDSDALDLVKNVRGADGEAVRFDPQMPLLVLSPLAGQQDRLLEHDVAVLAKPFSYPELRARVEALLRAGRVGARDGRLRVGPIEIDPAARTASLSGQHLPLSQKEFALLRALAADPTRVFTKEELLGSLWGSRTRRSARTLDSVACRLRQKLARDGERFVINVWAIGYRLTDGPLESAAAAAGR